MLKQVFDREQLSKALSSSDVWNWDLLSKYGNVEAAVDHTVQYWRSNQLSISLLNSKTINKKQVFTPSKMEDALAIKLLDRFIRRIYKVRQSDRNRIIRQLVTLLKDSGNYKILRLDIKECYESIKFKNLIDKFENDLILSPECIKLLNNIYANLTDNYNFHGLARGLSISPTLAELYLEKLDKDIASHPDVIYSARYVDDIIVLTSSGKETKLNDDIKSIMNNLNLSINDKKNKYYCGSTNTANFDYLGYSIKVNPVRDKANNVTVKISIPKINKIKSRIIKSFIDHKKNRDISLLKRRLEYISMLKVVKKGENGDLLAGLAHNYQYVTDNFECLKSIDGFIFHLLSRSRFKLIKKEENLIKKISIYGNAKKGNIGNFSKIQTMRIMRIWKNV